MNACITLHIGSGGTTSAWDPALSQRSVKGDGKTLQIPAGTSNNFAPAIEPINFKENVSDRMRKAEAIAFGLRTAIGVSASEMTALDERTGRPSARRIHRGRECPDSIDRERPNGR